MIVLTMTLKEAVGLCDLLSFFGELGTNPDATVQRARDGMDGSEALDMEIVLELCGELALRLKKLMEEQTS